MTILKRAGGVLITGAALAGMLALSVSSAGAATNAGVAATWTVKPGGAITAKAGTTTLKDTNTGSVLTCTSSSGKGTAKTGSGLSGTGIASIISGTWPASTRKARKADSLPLRSSGGPGPRTTFRGPPPT